MTSNQSSNILILDGRPIFKYDKEHIDASYSIVFPYILAKRIATKPEKFVEYILNDEAVRMIKKISEEKQGHIYYLIDTDFSEVLRKSLEEYYNELITFIMYDDYKEQYKDIKLVHTIFTQNYPIIPSPPHTPDMRFEMSEIISGLYLGGEETANNKELLKKNNMTVILNVTSNIPFYFESEFTYHRIPINDALSVDIKQYFDETFKIIDDTLTENKKILIHCQAGISRSATIVIAYIMKKNKMKMNDAYKLVHTRRPCIGPNLGFCGQLMLYEQEVMI
jgi:dual specificity MAP kinase phosphatase